VWTSADTDGRAGMRCGSGAQVPCFVSPDDDIAPSLHLDECAADTGTAA